MSIFAIFGAMVSALLGYDLGVLSGAIPHLKAYYGFHSTEIELIVGSFSVVQAIGTPIAGYFADILGRKPILGWSCAIATIGTLMMVIAHDFVLLLVGRIITGVGVGAGLAVAPTYLAELASQSNRGSVVSSMEIWINVGILSGFLSGAVFGYLDDPLSFRMMFGMGLIPCIGIVVGITYMPESPRFLIMASRQAEALQVLKDVLEDDAEINTTYSKMLEEVHSSTESNFHDIFQPRAALAVQTCLGFAAAFAFSGIDCVVYYTSTLFVAAGETDEHRGAQYALVMAFLKTVTICIAVWQFDKIGRKPLIMGSFAGMCATLIIAFVAILQQSPEILLVGLTLYVCSFSLGVGPGFYLLCTEVWPLRLRASGTAFAMTLRSFLCAILNISFLTLAKSLGYSTMILFMAVVAGAGVAFTMWCVIETKGRTLEEVTEDIDAQSEMSQGSVLSRISERMKPRNVVLGKETTQLRGDMA